jgi:hypothetical protein
MFVLFIITIEDPSVLYISFNYNLIRKETLRLKRLVKSTLALFDKLLKVSNPPIILFLENSNTFRCLTKRGIPHGLECDLLSFRFKSRNLILFINIIKDKMEASSSKGGPTPIDIKKLVNQIFQRRGAPEVRNFPKEFADGSK